MNLCSGLFMNRQGKESGKFLSHIQNGFPGRCMNHSRRLEDLMNRNRKAHTRGQHSVWSSAEGSRFRRELWQGIIPFFSIVQVGKGNIAAPYAPGFVSADGFRCSVCIGDLQVGDQFPLFSVEAGILMCVKTKACFIPAVSQQYRQHTALLQFLCYIKGLILYPFVIVIAVRSQVFCSDPFIVIKGLIESKSADIQSGLSDRPGRVDLFFKKRMPLLLIVAGDPLSCPGRLHLGGFKPRCVAADFFRCIGAYGYLPEIAGAGRERDIDLPAKAVRFRLESGICQQVFHICISSNLYACCCLLFTIGTRNLP